MGLLDFARNNNQALLQASMGLLGGQTGPQQAMLGMQGFANARNTAREQQQAVQQRNMTLEWLGKNRPELAQMVQAGLPIEQAWQEAIKQPKAQISEYAEREAAAQQYGLDINTPEGRAFVLGGKYEPGGIGGMPKTSLNPVFLEGPEGKVSIGQLTDAGELRLSQMPEGYQPMSPFERSRQTASGKVAGESEATATVNAPAQVQKADETIRLIDAMIEHPGRETATGLSSVLDPRNYVAGTDATDFNVRRKQLEGRAFLEAFESLKGGGQITQIEGEKATQAIARLSTAQSEKAYLEALMELRGIAELAKQRARTRIEGGASSPARTSSGIQWSIEP